MNKVSEKIFKWLYFQSIRKPNIPKMIYGGVVIMMVLFIISCFSSGQVDVSTTREEKPLTYREITEKEKEVIWDKQTPVGIRNEYRWIQKEPIHAMDCLIFYVIDQCVEVYIGDELVYQIALENEEGIGQTPGSNWVVVPLVQEDMGKEIRVQTIPIYKKFSKQEIDFFIGFEFIAYKIQMAKDSLQLLTSMVAIGVGCCLIVLFLYQNQRGRNRQEIMYSGLFFFTIGCWKIAEIPFIMMVFSEYTTAISYFSLGMLAVGCISVIFSISHYFSSKMHIMLEYTTLFQSALVMLMLYLQMSNRVDFRESIGLTHLSIMTIVMILVVASCIEVKKQEQTKKSKRIRKIRGFILICGATAMIDIMRYYSQGNSTRAIFIVVTFVFCMLNMDVLSIKKLRQKANLDQHTGLFNKSCCNERLDEVVGKQSHLALIMFDVNDLKKVNDSLGHEQGDVLIRDFAKIIRKHIHQSDFVGRYGGDEFIAIIKGADNYYLDEVTQCINQGVEQYNKENRIKNGFTMSYSSGYALSDKEKGRTLRELLQEADANMYANKKRYKQRMQEKNRIQERKGDSQGIEGVY